MTSRTITARNGNGPIKLVLLYLASTNAVRACRRHTHARTHMYVRARAHTRVHYIIQVNPVPICALCDVDCCCCCCTRGIARVLHVSVIMTHHATTYIRANATTFLLRGAALWSWHWLCVAVVVVAPWEMRTLSLGLGTETCFMYIGVVVGNGYCAVHSTGVCAHAHTYVVHLCAQTLAVGHGNDDFICTPQCTYILHMRRTLNNYPNRNTFDWRLTRRMEYQ